MLPVELLKLLAAIILLALLLRLIESLAYNASAKA